MFRTSLQRTVSVASRQLRKLSGHSGEEARAEALKWKKYSAGMVVLVAVVGAYNFVTLEHEHGDGVTYPYMHIRNKPYPWRECPDCNIASPDCWKACRGEATSAHH